MINELAEGIVITLENIIGINLQTTEKDMTYLLFHAFYNILSFLTNLINANLYFDGLRFIFGGLRVFFGGLSLFFNNLRVCFDGLRVCFATLKDSFVDLIGNTCGDMMLCNYILIPRNLFRRSQNHRKGSSKRTLYS